MLGVYVMYKMIYSFSTHFFIKHDVTTLITKLGVSTQDIKLVLLQVDDFMHVCISLLTYYNFLCEFEMIGQIYHITVLNSLTYVMIFEYEALLVF